MTRESHNLLDSRHPSPPASLEHPDAPSQRRAITWRSVLLGFAAVALVCGFAPYNDFVVNNNLMIGSYLPVVMVLFFFVLVVGVNPLLYWLAPRRALSSGELGVIMLMMLVSCGIPTQGLMRALIPVIIAPFYHGRGDVNFWQQFVNLHLPRWLFPVSSIAGGRTDPAAAWFCSRVPPGVPVPYRAWIVPLAGWGIFVAGMWSALVALATIVQEQWAVNERLPFPLAELELSLIQAPAPGKLLNELFRSRLFWIACAGVFCVQSMAGLHLYYPKMAPTIPLAYNLTDVLSREPWNYLDYHLRANRLIFTFIGVTYFISTRTSFSLWACFVIVQLLAAQQIWLHQNPIAGGAWQDQHLGACFAWAIGLTWVARHHLRRVLRHLVLGARPNESRSYRGAAIALLAGVAVMAAWLLLLGTGLLMTCIVIGLILLAHVVVARIVAETGIPIVRAMGVPRQIYTLFPISDFSARSIYFGGAFSEMGAFLTRESVLTFTLHGRRVAEEAAADRRQRPGLAILTVATLIVGFVIAAAASLEVYYHHETPLTSFSRNPVLNPTGVNDLPREYITGPLTQFAKGHFPEQPFNPGLHLAIGAVVTILLQAASLRWNFWPFAPVGYLVSTTLFIGQAWYSIFIGWLLKVVILRYGGTSLFRSAKPFFVGLIFGEALATGFWLVVSLLLVAAGKDYFPIQFLPT